MDSWLIFQHFSHGVTQGRIRLTIAELRLCRLVYQEGQGQKIYLALLQGASGDSSELKMVRSQCQEKLLNVEVKEPVPQTDTGVRV
jgi:hypothetical protein